MTHVWDVTDTNPGHRNWSPRSNFVLKGKWRPSRAQLGSADHFGPGVVSVAQLQQELEQRGWRPAPDKNPQVLGVEGKVQLDLTDPMGTRVEFMEFLPIKTPCCSPYLGSQPSPDSNQW